MGEAKRRGTFEERKQQALDRRAEFLALRAPEPKRPDVVTEPPSSPRQAAILVALASLATRQHGITLMHRRG